ncbi:MAG TPA: hypothetical protein VNZ57_14710, partial [Longimicrobiales bacterium]|nr:hypothetical protein [Longimicrobiales bacterium]
MDRLLTAVSGAAAIVALALVSSACGGGSTAQAQPQTQAETIQLPGAAVFYDFEHPVPGDPALEQDQGSSGTPLMLVNGGATMRVQDGAHPGSTMSLQTRQVNPDAAGNDDWKAGVYLEGGVPSLAAFSGVEAVTIMGWVKPMGEHPAPNTETPDPNDRYNAVGLMGLLSGNSDGHAVRALLELIDVNGTLRLVALGRRLDPGQSRTYAANTPWEELLPRDIWTFLAATFDFTTGEMALYRNGQPIDGFYTAGGDPWGLQSGEGQRGTSATNPAGIKIGGSFPQN